MPSFPRILLFATLPLLAACSGGGGADAPAAGLLPGSTLSAVRGDGTAPPPLRPEPGDIWAEGLQTRAP